MAIKGWQKIGIGLMAMGISLMVYLGLRQPQWLFALVSQLRPGALYFIETETPVIALTIDDGPHGETTEQILHLLERHGVKATFFMLGDRLSDHGATLRRLVASGHELGNHMTKDEASIRLTPEEFETDLMTAERQLSAYDSVGWFRPGMGWYNSRMVDVANRQGYRVVLGSLFPYDTHIPSVWFSEWFILNNLDPGDIWVLHDGDKGRGQRTVQLLERVLPKIQQRGYRVVTLTELSAYGQPTASHRRQRYISK
ncbi:MAG: chitin deacetylase family protein [Cyanobacteria bacterium P01_H01_bin.26]